MTTSVHVTPLPEAATVLGLIAGWIEDYNVTAVRSGQTKLDQSTLDRLIAEERDYWPWRHQKPDFEQEETVLRALLA